MPRAPLCFLLTCLLSTATALADRAAIQQVLDSMETAVLAGDIDGYLRHIAPDDPVFLKEQQNWAADLKLHIPSAFELSIVDPAPPEEEDAAADHDDRRRGQGVQAPVFDDAAGIARFELRMDWTMAGMGRKQNDLKRTISYPVIFRRAVQISLDGTTSARWLYHGEEWSTIDGTRDDEAGKSEEKPSPSPPLSTAPNRCFYFPGFETAAASVVSVLPEVRAHVDAGFENTIARVQEVKIYPSMRHLQASIYLSYVDGLAGWNEPGESIKLLASPRTGPERLRPLLAHEYGHVATFEYGPHSNDMPWWVLEGVAELSAEKYVAREGSDAKFIVDGWARADELAAWKDLTDFRTVRKEYGGHVYKQGQHMLGYISERFGRRGRNAWLRAMAQGSTIDEATMQALGMTFDQLDRAWRDSLPKPEPKTDEAPDDSPAPEQTPAPANP